MIYRVILAKEHTECNGRKYWLFNQREIVKQGNISLSTIKRTIKSLEDKGYIDKVIVENRIYQNKNMGSAAYVRLILEQ